MRSRTFTLTQLCLTVLGCFTFVGYFTPNIASAACPAGYVEITGRNGATICRNTGSNGPTQVPVTTGSTQTQNTNTNGSSFNGGSQGSYFNGGGSGSSFNGGSGQLSNPLQYSTLDAVLAAILDILIIFAIPLIVFFIMYAGFLYVTARGNESTIEKAHYALLYAVIGGLLILGAKAITLAIQGTVNQLF